MEIALVAAALLTVASFVSVGLMAYFALRPESRAPKCPRCDQSLRAGTQRCPRCNLPVESAVATPR